MPLIRELEDWLDRRLAEEEGPWGFKDPRTTRFLPLWRELFIDRNVIPRYLLGIRDPSEVVASVVHRDKVPQSWVYHTWLRYNLEALQYCGPRLAAVMDYGQWFRSSGEQLAALGQAIGVKIDAGRISEILATVLRPDLHRQKATNQQAPAWARVVYDGLAAQAAGNGHGVTATPGSVSRRRHARVPHAGPLPEGEGDTARAASDFHGKAQAEPSMGRLLAESEYFDALLRQGKQPVVEGPLTVVMASPQTFEAQAARSTELTRAGQRVVLSIPVDYSPPDAVSSGAVVPRDAPYPAAKGSPFAAASFEAYQWLQQRRYDAVHFPGGQGLATVSLDACHQGWPWPHGPIHLRYAYRPDWLSDKGALRFSDFLAVEAACLDLRAFAEADHLNCDDESVRLALQELTGIPAVALQNGAVIGAAGTELDRGDELPSVSVCVTCGSQPKVLRQCLASVRVQDYASLELVAVDGGGDEAAVRSALQGDFGDKGWKLISPAKSDLAPCRNALADSSSGDYLLFLDEGDILPPQAIANAVRVAQRTRSDIVTSARYLFSGAFTSGQSGSLVIFAGNCPLLGVIEDCYGDIVLVSRACWQRVGGLSEDADAGQEDWDFCARATVAGHSLVHSPEPLLYRADGAAEAGLAESGAGGLRYYAAMLPPPLAALPVLAGNTRRALLATERERDDLCFERRDLLAEREALLSERDDLRTEHRNLLAEREALLAEREALLAERERLLPEREALLAEREALLAEREALLAERDELRTEHRNLVAEREALVAERERLLPERERLLAERERLLPEREGLLAERGKLLSERESLHWELDETRNTLRTEQARLTGLLEQTRNALHSEQELRAALDAERSHLEEALAQVLASHSWRLTYPLRLMTEWASRQRQRLARHTGVHGADGTGR